LRDVAVAAIRAGDHDPVRQGGADAEYERGFLHDGFLSLS
jgi:hypothetical protein